MGAYSLNFYGISLSEHYDKIAEHIAKTLVETDLRSEFLCGSWNSEPHFQLDSYLEELKLGESSYDGGGYGQITYIGRYVPSSKRGVVVTDEIVADVEAKIAGLPDLLADAIRKVLGEIPEPEFITEEGWG